MDESRFDALARRLATGTSRRAGLKAAIGGLFGVGMAALAPAGESGAKKKKKKRSACPQPGQPCAFHAQCCGMCRAGQCCAGNHQQCAESKDCCDGSMCRLGFCVVAVE